MLVAFDGERPVGFVLAHELPRRHGDRAKLFVYEVEVAESHRRRGIASALLARLAELARERGIRIGFVLTEPGQRPGKRALPQRRRRDRLGDGRMDVLVRGRLTTLRPADADDVDRLVAWHADPEVARYWDDETFTPRGDGGAARAGGRRGVDRRGEQGAGRFPPGPCGRARHVPDPVRARARPRPGRRPGDDRAPRPRARPRAGDRRPLRLERGRRPRLGARRFRRDLTTRPPTRSTRRPGS